MIVARDVDFESIEKSRVYNGLYFILGGTIPILEKEPEKKVRLKELKERIKKYSDEESYAKKGSAEKNSAGESSTKENNLEEIILSLNITADGENTAEYIRQFIESNLPNSRADSKIKISVLGRGLSTGSELEYVDAETIKNALENRG